MFGEYGQALRDPTVPANRVVRKTAVLGVGLVVALVYYRHSVLDLGLWEPALGTLLLSGLAYGAIAVIGGTLAGGLYEEFLLEVGATTWKRTITTFLVEWLFALASPLLAALFFVIAFGGEV